MRRVFGRSSWAASFKKYPKAHSFKISVISTQTIVPHFQLHALQPPKHFLSFIGLSCFNYVNFAAYFP